MLSKGGKREYLCPDCESPDIEKGRIYGSSVAICTVCNTYWPWRDRINIKARPALEDDDDTSTT